MIKAGVIIYCCVCRMENMQGSIRENRIQSNCTNSEAYIILSSPPPPKLPRTNPFHLFKNFSKIVAVAYSASGGNFFYRHI